MELERAPQMVLGFFWRMEVAMVCQVEFLEVELEEMLLVQGMVKSLG